tara:strand:- start:393 stop:638 length:246 start_codon:yes stop_codon:yes gene_type:complete
MTYKQVEYLSGGKKNKVVKSGRVKMRPRKISGTRPKDISLVADHIISATNKGKPIKRFFLIRFFYYLGKKWNKFINNIFGM